MIFSNKFYDIMKDIALLWLPALSTLYAALAAIWGFPYETEIPATIMAVDTFLGVVLKLSKFRYDNNIPGDESEGDSEDA